MPTSFWDHRYTETPYAYGKLPNVFFQQCLVNLPKGVWLLPAEGPGRQAIFAAKQGHEVFAFDASETAAKQAKAWAATENLTIHYEVAEALQYQPNFAFDGVGLIFFHLPSSIRQQWHHQLLTWLKPGAHIIIECFSPQQLGKDSGGPQTLDMLPDIISLQHDFPGVEWLITNQTDTILTEGPFHQGLASLIQLYGVYHPAKLP